MKDLKQIEHLLLNTNKLMVVVFVAIQTLSSCTIVEQQARANSGHLSPPETKRNIPKSIPKPVTLAPSIPEPEPEKTTTYHTAVVNNVPVKELLFTLARDANLNLDVDSDVTGEVTLNAINQPLEVLLDRIVENADLIYEIKNGILRVSKDKPYLKSYSIDYINMSRTSESSSTVSTQIQSTGQGSGDSGGGGGGNNSATEVKNSSNNLFWETLYQNVAAILAADVNSGLSGVETSVGETSNDTGGQMTGNPNILVNPGSGIIAVRANKKQHREIEKFIENVLFSAKRQVLIEATIAEVSLSDTYQAGIDWAFFKTTVDELTTITNEVVDIELFNRPTFTIFNERVDGDKTLQGTLSALETFGDVTIMSSPKVMALNNQTALLKVVDNVVYFTVDVNIETAAGVGGTGIGVVTYETEVNTVPVGFVMSVTPFINDSDSVTLNIRPTISRIIGQARDPNPSLAEVGVISEIPIIQVREVESILKVDSGNIAVMGGLMQDEIRESSRGIPVLSRLPLVGRLFRYDSENSAKTELVIFIRPIVINKATTATELSRYSQHIANGIN